MIIRFKNLCCVVGVAGLVDAIFDESAYQTELLSRGGVIDVAVDDRFPVLAGRILE